MNLPIILITLLFVGVILIIVTLLWKKSIGELKQQNLLFQALRTMQKAALSTLEVDSLSQVVVDTINTELGSTFGMVGLITTDGKGVKISALSKAQNEKLKASPETAQIAFVEQVIPLTESTT